MLKSMRKSKNRCFYHIFVSPGDAPGAITLNVVWMEREFDAYKLSRCMCPSKSCGHLFVLLVNVSLLLLLLLGLLSVQKTLLTILRTLLLIQLMTKPSLMINVKNLTV